MALSARFSGFPMELIPYANAEPAAGACCAPPAELTQYTEPKNLAVPFQKVARFCSQSEGHDAEEPKSWILKR